MNSARRVTLAGMGAWMGLAGIEHGAGEFLQGNVTPQGLMIQSWPGSAFFAGLNGEPAMTVLPDLRLTGILAVLFSALFIAWRMSTLHSCGWFAVYGLAHPGELEALSNWRDGLPDG